MVPRVDHSRMKKIVGVSWKLTNIFQKSLIFWEVQIDWITLKSLHVWRIPGRFIGLDNHICTIYIYIHICNDLKSYRPIVKHSKVWMNYKSSTGNTPGLLPLPVPASPLRQRCGVFNLLSGKVLMAPSLHCTSWDEKWIWEDKWMTGWWYTYLSEKYESVGPPDDHSWSKWDQSVYVRRF